MTKMAQQITDLITARSIALKIAQDLDRNALLSGSLDDRSLSDIELESTVAVISNILFPGFDPSTQDCPDCFGDVATCKDVCDIVMNK